MKEAIKPYLAPYEHSVDLHFEKTRLVIQMVRSENG